MEETSLLIAVALLYTSSVMMVFGSLIWLAHYGVSDRSVLGERIDEYLNMKIEETLFDLSDSSCMILSYECCL